MMNYALTLHYNSIVNYGGKVLWKNKILYFMELSAGGDNGEGVVGCTV